MQLLLLVLPLQHLSCLHGPALLMLLQRPSCLLLVLCYLWPLPALQLPGGLWCHQVQPPAALHDMMLVVV